MASIAITLTPSSQKLSSSREIRMLRFFEPEAEPRWQVSVAPPDHCKFARMRDDAVLPLLTSIAGTNSVASQQLDGLNSYNGNFLDITSHECNSFLFGSAPLNQTPGQASLPATPTALTVSGLTSHQDLMKCSENPRKHTITRATMGRESRRHKSTHNNNQQTPAIYPTIKEPVMTVKKSQKLGDKITALQQLVSPFGKTDTASVLQEACGYIKVLHEQIRVLSSPYFGPKISPGFQGGAGDKLPLRGRGLCLVPISSSTIIGLTDHQELLDQHKSTRSITGWESTTGARLH